MQNIILKYRHLNKETKAAMWYTLCNILQKGIMFLTIPIYVRLLTTEEYGNYNVFNSWKEVLVILATLNLYAGVYTKAMVDLDQERDKYTSSMQGLSTIITVVLLCVYAMFSSFFNTMMESDSVSVLLLFAYFLFHPSISFWLARQRVEYKYIKMVIVTLLVSALTPLLSIILLFSTSLR